ncbi:SDR family oxidoreductase [Kordiimonas aquimaris]|uniref:SDR family oxidoreductase n=1 Tax=Kordiimonas aquimaris TaxID=707591 RepID=UPI0021D0C8C6|nr:SDR family oxidoreductase [Kordiimonas aquimaris]
METQTGEAPHLLVLGPGYSAAPLMDRTQRAGWRVSATWRRQERAAELEDSGIKPVALTKEAFAKDGPLSSVTHVLVSIAPNKDGDPVLTALSDQLEKLPLIKWIGYLSSTNVYGDHGGAWVDETSTTKPSLDRGKRRLEAEENWTALGTRINAVVHIFRLAGIYGPGKNAIRSVMDGKAKRTIKQGQVFGRIHRDDIASALWLAANSDIISTVFNLTDDLPAPPQDVITAASQLLGVAPPPIVAFEDANLSAMGRSFYAENKRVRNIKAKQALGWRLEYPDYHQALPKLLVDEICRI